MSISIETKNDFESIAGLYHPGISALIKKLRKNPKYSSEYSFVFKKENVVVAHVFYFPISVTYNRCRSWTMMLQFAAVLPEWKRKGFLTELVSKSLNILKDKGHKSVLVNGNPQFYQRFGFKEASHWQIYLPETKKENNKKLLGIELETNGFAGLQGELQYSWEFNS